MARGIVGWMRSHDPENAALAKAIKVAIAVTAGLAIGTAVGNAQMSLFASFGGIAMLLFADFPGNRSARLGAYLGLFVAGAALIALGTLMSGSAWLAISGMAVVGFLVLLCGVLSSAIAGAARAALLSFILPVMVPVPVAEIPSRWAGWLLAAVLSVPLAVLLWPPRDHDALRRAAAATCAALADQLAANASGADASRLGPLRQASANALAALRRQFTATDVRPVGLTTGSRHLIRLTGRLEWLSTVADRLPTSLDDAVAHAAVVEECTATLRAAAAVLTQAAHHPSFEARHELSVRLRTLQQLHAGTRMFARLVRTPPPADQATDGPPDHPATMMELVYTTRLAGLTVAAAAAADARPLVDRLLGRNLPGSGAGPLMPIHRVLLGHLSLRSVWFQNSVRGALGLTIAVAIAEFTEVSHGFWVVLGAMSVLRTTALNTGSTALRALGGTLIGFVVGSLIMVTVGTTAWHLWLLLPVALLVAGYLPAAVSFVAGQAAFTVLVVVLFNIISPSGWQVGLVRVEDVLFGCASALISGVLLWPHGAAAQIRTTLAECYRRSGQAVVAATRRLTAGPGSSEPAAEPASFDSAMTASAASSLRLDDAMREYLFERGTRNVPLAELVGLANGAARVRMTAEAIAQMTPLSAPDRTPGADAVNRSADTCGTWFGELADQIARREPAPPLSAEPAAEATVLAELRARLADGAADPANGQLLADGRTLWGTALYLDSLVRAQRRLGPRADSLAARHRPPHREPAPPPPSGRPAAAASRAAGGAPG